MFIRSIVKPALLAGAVGALLGTTAYAQDNGRYDNAAYSADQENITVTAPQYRVDRSAPLGVPNKVSLSQRVAYDDLDLTTRSGARELRERVVAAARDVCGQLADAVPVAEERGTSCYRTARQDALIKADEAIRDARD
jgi:UrcA family protein